MEIEKDKSDVTSLLSSDYPEVLAIARTFIFYEIENDESDEEVLDTHDDTPQNSIDENEDPSLDVQKSEDTKINTPDLTLSQWKIYMLTE